MQVDFTKYFHVRKRSRSITTSKEKYFVKSTLTDCPCVGQTKAEKAKSRIFVKVGWFDPPMGGIDQPQYFCPGAHPSGGGSPP